jgi:two-component system LytT family sensor kinase
MWRRVFLAQPIDLRAWLMDTSWITRWQIEWEITMYWAVVGLAHVLVFREEVRARALQAARLDAELSQAKLQALQQQIHPHFLFNTLQSISVLMHHNVESAEEMMERLGALLRGSLRTQTSAVVPLSRELAYVGHYLAVEGMNLGDRLRVQQEVALEVTGCHVPELLLQPLVENAVRHGIAPSPTGGTVRIVARREGGSLFLEVSDDGVGPGQATEGAGIALENTRRRLALLYGDRHQFEILHGPERTGVTVRIRIPAAADAAVA